MVWSGLSARLWAFGHDWSAFLAALAVLTSAAYLAATWLAGRLHYTATVVLNTCEAAVLCHIIAALWTAPDGMAASALHALVCLGIGNGCLWLAICSWRCPLPFRWAFPQLAGMTVVFTHYTPTFCSGAGLYAACGLQAATCGVWHAGCLLAALALLGHRLYKRELAKRIAWHIDWCGRPPAGMQLVTGGLSYWLNFALPAVGCILAYSATLLVSPPSQNAGPTA